PGITADLHTSPALVQATLTACLLGLAFGQVIICPVSDAEGRKTPLILSTSLFVVASLLCMFAPNIYVLIAARFLQCFTASAGVVLSRAVVRDIFSGRELTKFFSLLMVINAVAPLAAPMSGGAILLLPFANWQTIFLSLAILGIVIV